MTKTKLVAHSPDQSLESKISLSNRRLLFILLGCVGALLFLIRLGSAPDLLDGDQERPASYVLDVVRNGNWICQRDLRGDIASKPPLYTWLAAGVSLAAGRISLFTLYLPGALAAMGSACLLLSFGRKHFGITAGMFAALALLLTHAGLKQFGLARTDALFAFTVTAAALLAFRAWQLGRGWTWFWLMSAAATLTKGPLGLVLAAGGLLAASWECKSPDRLRLRGSHLTGVAFFLIITAGWFWLAYLQFGPALIDKMIGKELVGHAMQSDPGARFYRPTFYYLGRAGPWSFLAFYAFWQLWRRPAIDPAERRFERFLFCWFALGLVIFSLAPHQRADLLWPIMPAGALLAGRLLARRAAALSPPWVIGLSVTTVCLALMVAAVYFFVIHPRKVGVRETVAVRNLAKAVELAGGRNFPLTHVDSPIGLQVYLNTMFPPITPARAAKLLRGPDAAYVAVNSLTAIALHRRAGDPLIKLFESETTALSPVRIYGNRPALNPGEPTAFCFGTLFVRLEGMRLVRATENECWFQPDQWDAHAILTNESPQARQIRVRVGKHPPTKRTLAPGESWELKLP